MITLRKRGQVYHADSSAGGRHRGSLGTRDKSTAVRLAKRLEYALADGPRSKVWDELRPILPASTFRRFSLGCGVDSKPETTWAELRNAYDLNLQDRVRANTLAKSSAAGYYYQLEALDKFFSAQKITRISEIAPAVMADFARENPAVKIVPRQIFEFAVERDMMRKSPVSKERKARETRTKVEPYTAEELARMKDAAGPDLLAFLLLRWTGLRGSDAVSLSWDNIDLEYKFIRSYAQKNGKELLIPIHEELVAALQEEIWKRSLDIYPNGKRPVLEIPLTGKFMTRAQLYRVVKKLGERAGVPNPKPHRFRHSLATEMLSKGASIYQVAQLLGDSVSTIERFYASFIPLQRQQVSDIMNSELGGTP